MLCRVFLVRTDVSEERISSIIRVERISEHSVFPRCLHQLLVTADVVPNSLIISNLMMEAIRSSETLVLTRARRHRIPEDGILHSHRRENLKSYTIVHFAFILIIIGSI
jgi:hypothetical protein